MNVRPVRDMVLIEPEPLEETTKGGIIVPKNVKSPHLIAKVLATGPGRILDSGRRVEPEVKAGDRVLVREFNMLQRVERLGRSDGVALVPEMDIDAVLEG